MMARNTNVPFKGRIQKRKTHNLQIITFGLQRAAGPYRRARLGQSALQQKEAYSITSSALARSAAGTLRRSAFAVTSLSTSFATSAKHAAQSSTI